MGQKSEHNRSQRGITFVSPLCEENVDPGIPNMASHYRAAARCPPTPACVCACAPARACRPRVQMLGCVCVALFFFFFVRWREKEQAQCVGQGVSLMRLYSCGMRVTHTDNGQGNI